MATPDGPADDIFDPGGRLRLDLLTEPAAAALREALRLARETRWDSVRSPHVFMGLLAVPDPSLRNWGDRLQADLAVWARKLDGGTAADRARVKTRLMHWRADADLAGLREPAALDGMSADEREECVALWNEVNALLKRAGQSK